MRGVISWGGWGWLDRVVLGLVVGVPLVSLFFYLHGPYNHGDIQLYHQYASAFWLGSPPFRSLPAEYPILALLPFSLTLLPPLPDFLDVFAAWMLLLLVGLYAAVRRWESPRAAHVLGLTLALGGFATLVGRYDLIPAALTVAALWAARGGRFRLAYLLLAAGALLKLYPLFLVPAVMLEQRRAGGLRTAIRDGVGLFALPVAAGFGISALLDPQGWLGPLSYNTHRPLQVESVPATLLWLTGMLGLPVAPNHSFHSYNLIGQLDRPLSGLATVALVTGCLWTWWRQATGRLPLERAMALTLLVVICTNRVFSPQYLIWVLPLVAIVEARFDSLWLGICALTTAIFPFAYLLSGLHGMGTPASYPPLFLTLIATRNTLLLVATIRFGRPDQANENAYKRWDAGT